VALIKFAASVITSRKSSKSSFLPLWRHFSQNCNVIEFTVQILTIWFGFVFS